MSLDTDRHRRPTRSGGTDRQQIARMRRTRRPDQRFKRLRDIADDISHLTPVEAGITVSWIIGSDLGMKAHMIIVELTNRFFRLGCDPTLLD
jgi:hypothetical protein